MLSNIMRAGAAALVLSFGLAVPAATDTMQDVIAKDKLVVGVKTDYPPWGTRDTDGNIIGLEIDLAEDIARRLSERAGKDIALETVSVVASNRMEFLKQGQIDLMIATMSDTEPRRKEVGILQPNYYSSGVAVFAHTASGVQDWPDLQGKDICGIQGAWYNKDFGERNGANMISFPGVPEVEKALLDGRCVGWLYDDSAFVSRKTLEPEKWQDYDIATPVVADVPWGIAVRLPDLDGPWGEFVSDAIIDWLKSGTIGDLEEEWGIPRTQWVKEMTEKCLAGHPECDRDRSTN